jgi:hypothetical protein
MESCESLTGLQELQNTAPWDFTVAIRRYRDGQKICIGQTFNKQLTDGKLFIIELFILSRDRVTINGVWTDDRIYWTV